MKNQLLAKAIEASQNAYAPYSDFKVGAAVLIDNGEIITGANVENASYGLSMCAERVAIFKTVTQFPNAQIVQIAVASPNDNSITPCGACRQVIAEFAQKQKTDIEIIMMINGKIVAKKISDLLPFAFKITKK